jgi:hypothetical protein
MKTRTALPGKSENNVERTSRRKEKLRNKKKKEKRGNSWER